MTDSTCQTRLTSHIAGTAHHGLLTIARQRCTRLTGRWRRASTRNIGQTESATTTIRAPSALPAGAGAFVEVDITADSAAHPTWQQPVRTWFRRTGDGWKLVGLDRLADGPHPPAPAGPIATKADK